MRRLSSHSLPMGVPIVKPSGCSSNFFSYFYAILSDAKPIFYPDPTVTLNFTKPPALLTIIATTEMLCLGSVFLSVLRW
ncbi:unnamed protein product [Microthlaspi erraticum]|uniref:Uncharacterized protein n=1 Tax=Microthlaspi erraticum TaxID=1685480 RepID=A0A6D2JEZ0_9BRAS|nr:unnamed protein product [Microthlaspi erraticum]